MQAQKREFYDEYSFDVINKLEHNYNEIKNEFFTVVTEKDYSRWYQKELYNDGWSVFGLRLFREEVEAAHEACPALSRILMEFSDLIVTAGFSILKPGTIIYPHVGYTEDVLRCHLGIKIPQGDCAIKVGGKIKRWEEGKAFVFDDTFMHEAWNRTDDSRIVLLLDFDKNILLGDQLIS